MLDHYNRRLVKKRSIRGGEKKNFDWLWVDFKPITYVNGRAYKWSWLIYIFKNSKTAQTRSSKRYGYFNDDPLALFGATVSIWQSYSLIWRIYNIQWSTSRRLELFWAIWIQNAEICKSSWQTQHNCIWALERVEKGHHDCWNCRFGEN